MCGTPLECRKPVPFFKLVSLRFHFVAKKASVHKLQIITGKQKERQRTTKGQK